MSEAAVAFFDGHRSAVPELYYYADPLFEMRNYSAVPPEALAFVHSFNWQKFKATKLETGNDEQMSSLNKDKIRDDLLELISYIEKNQKHCLVISRKMGEFFTLCMSSGYLTLQEIVDDTKFVFSVNDLRLIFLPYVHPRLVDAMPDVMKSTADEKFVTETQAPAVRVIGRSLR